MSKTALILDLYLGKPEQRWEGKEPSAIGKLAASGPKLVNHDGFLEDQQADLSVHGGPDKAVHQYPSEHYELWRSRFPETSSAYRPGGFGENISSRGLTEEDLCIGDVLSAGTALLQVSHGRQPCWKLNMHSGNPGLAAAFKKECKTGWYCRVVQPGQMQAGDEIKIVERPCPQWNLKDVIHARFNPNLPKQTAAELADLKELAEAWRSSFAKSASA